MPDIGRYMAYDLLVEKTFEPYGYCYNNPVNVIDPTGMSGQDWIQRGKDIIFDAAITNQSEAEGKYGAEVKHLGEGTTLTGTIGGDTVYQYTFHNDGTITDCNGGNADAAGGFTTAGGTNIHGTDGIFINDFFASLSSGSQTSMDSYRATRDNPGYNQGESKFDRIFRLMNSSHIENMRDAASGFSYGGYGSAPSSMTMVGRWMSQGEYDIMAATGQMVEGAGGQTFVATGGPSSFTSAARGSIYAEFEVPTSSLLQGGQSNWFKTIGPNAKPSQLFILQKQGGQVLPPISNLSPILQTK